MTDWATRVAKAGALLAGGLRALSVQTIEGDSIRLPLEGHRRFWRGRMQDADLVAFLASSLPADGVFLDVGANIGVYSAALARSKGPSLRGAAFEPVPATHAILRETLRLNQMHRFTSEMIALSNAPGELLFSAHGGGANNCEVREPAAARVPTIRVAAIRLDDWVRAHPALAPDAMKIDVEGQELAVLEGAVGVLERSRPALVVECHCASWPELGVSARRVHQLLEALGYVPRDRSGAPIALTDRNETVQVVCARPQ